MGQNSSDLKRNLPTRGEALLFRGKAVLLQLRRGVQNLSDRRIRKHPVGNRLIDETIVAESKTPLWTESDRAEEMPLVAGKVHNLRLAIQKLDGAEIGAGEIFSFWRQIGRAKRARGFAAGRELREGCLVPSVGGGLCQLSNALYDAALRAAISSNATRTRKLFPVRSPKRGAMRPFFGITLICVSHQIVLFASKPNSASAI